MTAKTPPASLSPRKELAEQINRLDSILDGLSDAINQTVIQAVRDGARLAIKDAIADFLGDQDIQTRLVKATVEKAGSKKRPSFFSRLMSEIRKVITAAK